MKTREKILDAAWGLFSKSGFEDVSVRDVTNLAGVNLASVSYHFGSKSGLIQEIVKEALVPLNKQRVVLLKEAGEKVDGVENVDIVGILEALIRPVVRAEEYGKSNDMISRLMARYLIERDYDVPAEVNTSFGDVYKIFGIAIASQCPHLTPTQALEKLIFSTGAVFMFESFSGLAARTLAGVDLDRENYIENAVKFCAEGFKATT